MNRLYFVSAALLFVGCGHPKQEFGSICTEAPAPPACGMACDALPGALNTCGDGFHCTEDSTCDATCTIGGHQCGEGYRCTADGFCVDASGPGTNGPDAYCPAINFTPIPTTPSIGLVLDRSYSMNNTDISPDRYTAMKDALTGPSGVVTALQTKAYVGSELYTCNGDNVDLITVPRALNNAAAIRDSMAAGPSDGTPTPEAIDAMVASFAANPPPPGSPPIIVLATDGEPITCIGNDSTKAQSVAAAAAAYAAGIPVYVLAIAQNSQHFQDVANAGQGHQPADPDVPYYPVASAQELKTAFDRIIAGVISCDLSLTSSIDASYAMDGTLTVNGSALTYGTEWALVGGNTIRVLGAACTALKNTPNPIVTATFPCGSVIL